MANNQKHVFGDIKHINSGSDFFKDIREKNSLYIDKTRFIENIFNTDMPVALITRQRRMGKSLNLNTLKVFLEGKEPSDKILFNDLYITKSPIWQEYGQHIVINLNFKDLQRNDYKYYIYSILYGYITKYLPNKFYENDFQKQIDKFLNEQENNTKGLYLATRCIYETTGKKPFILIDEYDKLLMDNYAHPDYNEMRDYLTATLSAGLKSNEYVGKCILTGVNCIAKESMFSGLNNISMHGIFDDDIFTTDFGFTEEEMDELQAIDGFDKQKVKDWYNGVKINGTSIYNTYSVINYLNKHRFDNYWGQSGAIDLIKKLMITEHKQDLNQLFSTGSFTTRINTRVSMLKLVTENQAKDFYSLLCQNGYFACERVVDSDTDYEITIPNKELKYVWEDFLLGSIVYEGVQNLFKNIKIPQRFDNDLYRVIAHSLSYFDFKGDEEQAYHNFMLGVLAAYKSPICKVTSNREAGYGRYDCIVEHRDFNVIFEFKMSKTIEDFKKDIDDALAQIEIKQYYKDLDLSKYTLKVGVAFKYKDCLARSVVHI
jgi:Predicted AAA-ATPase/PD-(D/E)XK nuclease superfamily